MQNHSEAEHQNDCVHIESDGVCPVQYIKDTVIAEVDDQRIDGVVPNVCAAMKIPYIGLREFMDRILD